MGVRNTFVPAGGGVGTATFVRGADKCRLLEYEQAIPPLGCTGEN